MQGALQRADWHDDVLGSETFSLAGLEGGIWHDPHGDPLCLLTFDPSPVGRSSESRPVGLDLFVVSCCMAGRGVALATLHEQDTPVLLALYRLVMPVWGAFYVIVHYCFEKNHAHDAATRGI